MKETIYTIPLMDAFNAKDECPFCFLEREAEQHAIEFILGSGASYMEDDIRADTDKNGFCRHHYKMMYDYGNRLGASLILGTHFKKLNEELKKQIEDFKPQKTSFFNRMKKTNLRMMESSTNIGHWVDEKLSTCYVCDHFHSNYERYLDTFFDMYKSNPEFAKLFQESKGFCLPHFKDLVETAEKKLNDKQKESFYPVSPDGRKYEAAGGRSKLVCSQERLSEQRQRLGKFPRQRAAMYAESGRRISCRPCIQD